MRKSVAVLLVLVFLIAPCIAVKPARSSTDVAENTWTPMTPLPIGVAGAKATVVGGKIYVIVSNINYEYDPATNTWATRTPMPTPRSDGIAVATSQSKIYVLGGRINGGVTTGINEVYDPATDTWETKTPMPTSREDLEANVVNGKIYLISGLIPDPKYPATSNTFVLTNINEVYDPLSDSWSTATSIPTASADYASAVVDDKIFIISGSNRDIQNLTQIYTPETDTWTYGSQIPRGVQAAMAVATKGTTVLKAIYVMGGFEGFVWAVDYVQIYHPENDSWTTGIPLPTARYDLALAVVEDEIYAIGGSNGLYQDATTQNDRYIPFRDQTEPEQGPFPTLVAASIACVAVIGVGLLVYFKKRKH
jgi:N-acetylneuraminic acid mutarotase